MLCSTTRDIQVNLPASNSSFKRPKESFDTCVFITIEKKNDREKTLKATGSYCSIVTNLSHCSNNIEAVQNQREAFKAKINKKYFLRLLVKAFHLDNIYCIKYITKNWYYHLW